MTTHTDDHTALNVDTADAADADALIEKLTRILDQLTVAVNGELPADTLWGFDDLPDRVAQLVREAAVAELRAAAAAINHDGLTPGEWKVWMKRAAAAALDRADRIETGTLLPALRAGGADLCHDEKWGINEDGTWDGDVWFCTLPAGHTGKCVRRSVCGLPEPEPGDVHDRAEAGAL